MSLRLWPSSSRNLVGLFLLVTVVPCGLVVFFGQRLFQDDRERALRQIEERRKLATTLGVAALERSVTASERQLRTAAGALLLDGSSDAVVVTFVPGAMTVTPPERLLYRPIAPQLPEAPARLFSHGEELEFRARDLTRAATWFRGLASSAEPAVRAGAMFRLARTLRKSGLADQAAILYGRITQIPGVVVEGVPADLLARWAQCDLLAGEKRPQLRSLARDLYDDLLRGRWPLDRAGFTAHLADAARWAGRESTDNAADNRRRLSAAVETLWDAQLPHLRTAESRSGRQAVQIDGELVTMLWTVEAGRLVALIAGAGYAQDRWVSPSATALEAQGFQMALHEPRARIRRNVARPLDALEIRDAAETGLPWTVAVESSNLRAELDEVAARGRMWLLSLALLVLLLCAGAYVVGRAVTRELAVARLQADFVAAVSHEFKTPLTTLRQLTEVLVDSRVAGDRRHVYYEALARQTRRLERLVDGVLDLGQMEAGASTFRKDPLDAVTLACAVVDEFQSEVRERGYEIDLRLPSVAAAPIVGDAEALRTAVRNLLDNAVKYSPTCRRIWVDVEPTREGLAIAVRDRGLGVPPHELHEIFGKFVRGSLARSQGIKGTGIGLALVRHIVQAHGGRVHAESNPGSGSTFTILLPFAGIEDRPPQVGAAWRAS